MGRKPTAELSAEARELRNAYYREWRSKNKDKVKQYQARKWEKKAQEVSEESR